MLLYKDFKISGSEKTLQEIWEKSCTRSLYDIQLPLSSCWKSRKLTNALLDFLTRITATFCSFVTFFFYQKLHTYLDQIACNTNTGKKNPNLKIQKWQNCFVLNLITKISLIYEAFWYKDSILELIFKNIATNSYLILLLCKDCKISGSEKKLYNKSEKIM